METNTENWKDHLQKGGSLMIVILGNILYALAVKLFLMPAGLLTGGTTGIGLALNRSFGIPVATFVLIFNVTMLLIGWKVMGRKFALTTVVSTFVYPIALGFFEKVFGDLVLTQDLFLCTIFSGLGIGGSLGIVIRAGASTGGMDIPPLVLNHYFKIPVSVSMYVFDFCILLAQAVGNPPEKVLYGLILVMTYTLVLDKLMLITVTDSFRIYRYPGWYGKSGGRSGCCFCRRRRCCVLDVAFRYFRLCHCFYRGNSGPDP